MERRGLEELGGGTATPRVRFDAAMLGTVMSDSEKKNNKNICLVYAMCDLSHVHIMS